jgi:hypothetical protein
MLPRIDCTQQRLHQYHAKMSYIETAKSGEETKCCKEFVYASDDEKNQPVGCISRWYVNTINDSDSQGNIIYIDYFACCTETLVRIHTISSLSYIGFSTTYVRNLSRNTEHSDKYNKASTRNIYSGTYRCPT